MPSDTPSRARSWLAPVCICLGISAALAELLASGVQKARDAARMAQLT